MFKTDIVNHHRCGTKCAHLINNFSEHCMHQRFSDVGQSSFRLLLYRDPRLKMQVKCILNTIIGHGQYIE